MSASFMLAIIVFFMFIWTHLSAEILSGSQSNLGSLIDVAVSIDTTTDTVDIIIIGPSNKWFGVGFGSNSMVNSYALLAYGANTVTEHKLISTGPGTALTPGMITVNNDTTNSATSTRTIQMSRNRAVTSQQETDGFYSFPNVAGDFPFLWAYGTCTNPCNSLNNVKKHTAQQRATGTFNVIGTPQPTTSPITYEPTNNPSKNPTKTPTKNPSKTPTNNPITSTPTKTGETRAPTINPTSNPTVQPTTNPTTSQPTTNPTTSQPTTSQPTNIPTINPTINPTNNPTIMNRIIFPGFEACTETMSVVNGVGTIKVIIGRNINVTEQSMMIDMSGPLDQWFGFGFDESVSNANALKMQDTYAVTVAGNTPTTTDDVVERILGNWNIGSVVSSSSYDTGDLMIIEESDRRRVQIIRAWKVDNTYDFTSFMQCGMSSIGIISAIGSDAMVTGHTMNARGMNIIERICECDGVTDSPTSNPIMSSTQEQDDDEGACEQNDFLKAEGSLNDFMIAIKIDCHAKTVLVDITSQYNENWFGIVFSDSMIGTALIWTTHNPQNGEAARDLGLYQYLMTDKTGNMVKYDDTATEWMQVSETINDGIINIVYIQSVDNSFINIDTKDLQLRWAKGNDNGLQISYHDVNGRSSATLSLNLLTGKASIDEDDLSLQIAHGVIMWIAWCILASFGIMSSPFRFLYPKGPKWFFVHRGVQCVVVVLCVIGFILAIVFTQQKGNPHFNNSHTIIGLVVTLLGILQPINAYFRSHPPPDGWPQGKKPRKRKIWEFIHKKFGYIAWILACITVMFGLKLIGEDTLAYVHMFGYCGLLLGLYIAFSIIKYLDGINYTRISDNNDNAVDGDTQLELATSTRS